MKKNTRLLLVIIFIVVLLGVGLTVVLLLPSENDKITTDERNEILLFDKSNLLAESISVDNSGGTYELLAYEYTKPIVTSSQRVDENMGLIPAVNDDEEEYSPTELIYTMQEYSDFTLDQNMTNDLAKQACYMAARELIDKSGRKYAEYGLDTPKATVRVRYSDASSVIMYLGSEAPDNKGVYLRIEGDRNVYLVESSLTEAFFIERLQLFDKHLTGTMENIHQVRISGSHYQDVISLTANDSSYYPTTHLMEQPVSYICDNSQFSLITNSACSLQAAFVAAVDPTKEDIRRCGLEQPYEQFDMTDTDGGSIHLIASEKDNENCFYLMKPGDRLIFRTYAVDNKWYDVKMTDFWPDTVMNVNTEEIRDLTLNVNGLSVTYHLEKEKGMSEDYHEGATLTLTADGEMVNYSNYSAFVNNLTNIKRQSLETGDFEKNQEILRAEFSYFYVQGITDTLHLYRQKSGKTVAVLNDKIICFVDSDYVDQVVQQVSLLHNSNVLIPLINEGGSVSDTSKVS